MEIITQDFTYNLPDAYMSSSIANGDTATLEYHGPDEIWVFVDKTSGMLDWSMHALINFDESVQEMATIHAGNDKKAVLVHFDQNPLICWAMYGELDWDDLGEKTYTLDGETEPYFTHPDPLPPQMIYEYPRFQYLFDVNAWKTPYPMITSPALTQEELEAQISSFIAGLESQLNDVDLSMDAEQRSQMETIKTQAEAIITKYGPDGADVPYYMWPAPGETPNWDPDVEADDDVPEDQRWTKEANAEFTEDDDADTTTADPDTDPTPASTTEAFPNSDSQDPPEDPDDSEEE